MLNTYNNIIQELAIANRLRVSCAYSTSRPSLMTP